MLSGLKPVAPDTRDLSFPGTFGSASPTIFPEELNLDAGYGFPDQNADGYPMGCTGYTQSELAQDEDKEQYDPVFTYEKSLMMDNLPKNSGVQIRTSLKSTIVYGLRRKDGYGFPEDNRRGQYFNVADVSELDDFDDIRSALFLNRRPVSIGTPWFKEWRETKQGIVSDFKYLGSSKHPWHNWKICGWKTIKGKPYLIGKPWTGPDEGDGGWYYFPREVINKLMKITHVQAFTLARARPEDLKTIKLSIIETILAFLYRLKLIG